MEIYNFILCNKLVVTPEINQPTSLDSKALINKSLVMVKNFIWGKVSKLFYHLDL